MSVDTKHADYKAFSAKWKRCRDVAAGADAVHHAGEEYLPKLKGQQPDDYKAYVLRSTFYNASWRTIAGLVGMMFRKPPTVEVPKPVEQLLEDVDGAGQPFQPFTQSICEQAVTIGRIGILVDAPPAPDGATLADAKRLNLRPQMQMYLAESIINWKTGSVNNRNVLTMVVLKETADKVIDEFTVETEDVWRVLDLVAGPTPVGEQAVMQYRQRIFKQKKAAALGGGQTKDLPAVAFEQIGADVYPKMGGKPIPYIPFIIMGTDDVTPEVDDPPLIDLFDMNLSHYRTSADYAHGCHFTALPTLFLSGFKTQENEKIYLGAETAIVSSSPDARAMFVEFSGAGMQVLENKLEREERQMAVLGARMLEPQKMAVETAETTSIHRKGEESLLSSIAQTISLGVTQVLKIFTEWAGESPEAVKFELNRDFYPAPMDPAMLSGLMAAWQSGAISDQTLFDKLQAGEIISADTTLEDEQARTAARRRELAAQEAGGGAGFDDVTE